MKKYCLTQCFKDNMSRKTKAVIEIISVLTVLLLTAAAIVVAGTLIFGAIGVITQFTTLYFNPATGIFAMNPIKIGLLMTLTLSFIGFVTYITLHVIIAITHSLYKGTKNIVTNIVAPEQAECRIFEECKD